MKEGLSRVAFSPGEFAQLFGKAQTWGYRRIYAGKVKAITEHGRILIPAAEVEAILKTAGINDGMKSKVVKTKAELQSFASRLHDAWQRFLAARRLSAPQSKKPLSGAAPKVNWPSPRLGRQAALARLTRKGKSEEKPF